MVKNGSGVTPLLEAAQISTLFSGARFVFAINAVNSIIVAFVLWGVVSATILVLWILAVLGITATRFRLLLDYEQDELQAERLAYWKRVAVWGAALSGLAWGFAAILLFPHGSPLHQIFLLTIMLGMMAGSATSWHAYFPAFQAYFLPVAIFTLIRFVLEVLSREVAQEIFTALAAMFLIFTVGLYFFARKSNRVLEQLLIAQYAKEAAEDRYRALFQGARTPMFLINPVDGRIVDCNAAAADYYGYQTDQLKQMNVAQINTLSREEIAEKMLQASSRKESSFNFRHRMANGDVRDVEVLSGPVKLEGQQLLYSIVHDISERIASERQVALTRQALDAEHLRFQAILDNAPLGIWYLGIDGNLQFVNKTFCRSLGVSEEQFLAAQHYAGVLPQEVANHCIQSDRECFERDIPHISKEWMPFVDGKQHLLEITKVKLVGSNGITNGLIGLSVDITERMQAEESLLLTASVFNNSQEGILITDADNNILDVNTSYSRITGYSREEVLGKNPKLLSSGHQDKTFYDAMWQSLQEHGTWRGEIWNRRKSGEIYAALLSISVIRDENGRVQRHVGLFLDISHIKAHEAELIRVAHYDMLTGVPNRALLADRMKQAKAQTLREQDMMAVCYLDLDGFKSINDTMGHEAGDQVLIEVAQRIMGTIRGGDTVARLGGDEFVILLLGQERGEECVATLERLLKVISLPITVRDQSVTLGASIGVSIYPLDDEDVDTLLRHADQAMYLAKQAGKNRFHIYDPSLDQRTRVHHTFLENIRGALEYNQFELHYQPKINLRSGLLVGAEALIRWRHPEKGLLPPAEFLHAIENTDLDIEIGEWVISTALAQIQKWRAAGLDIEVSINISAYHLESSGFVEKLRQKMAQHTSIPIGRLQIEVLETAALDDVVTVNGIIKSCREFGVKFALDDFGTGYSSLTYLSKLPVDTLKIDQSFVRDMLEDKGDMAIVHGIIALARTFELQIVAEGIETREHYNALLDMGCEIGQGYGIARPMAAEALVNWRAK